MPLAARQGLFRGVRGLSALIVLGGLMVPGSGLGQAPPSHTEFYLGLRASVDVVSAASASVPVGLDGLSLGASLLGGDWFLELELGGLLSRAFHPLGVFPQRKAATPPGAFNGTDSVQNVPRGPLFFAAAGTHVPLGPGTVATGITLAARERGPFVPTFEWGFGLRINYPWRLAKRWFWAPGFDFELLWPPSTKSSGLQAGLHNVLRFRLGGAWWLRNETKAGLGRRGRAVDVWSFESSLALAWVGPSP